VLHHEEIRKRYPAAYVHVGGYVPAEEGKEPNRMEELEYLGANWVVEILPFAESGDIRDRMNLDRPMADATNRQARSATLGFMACPTDPFALKPFNGTAAATTRPLGDGWARGNYGANGALGYANYTWPDSAGGPAEAFWKSFPGVMGGNTAMTHQQITDGTSKTVLLGELRAGLTEYDPRGVWALGKISSSLWAHGGIMGDAAGPNASYFAADDICTSPELIAEFGSQNALVAAGMPVSYGPWVNKQQSPRSLHAGGIFVAMADGSVRWISDLIQVVPSYSHSLSVWDRIMVSNDGMTVGRDQY